MVCGSIRIGVCVMSVVWRDVGLIFLIGIHKIRIISLMIRIRLAFARSARGTKTSLLWYFSGSGWVRRL